MEEILASIRRIISEDDAPAAEGAAEAGEPAAEEPVALAPLEPQPALEPEALKPELPEPPAPAGSDDEVLELTEKVAEPIAAEPEVETHGDLDVYASPEPEPVVAAAPAWKPADEEPLLGQGAAQTAASAFGSLAQRIAMPAGGRTLEDVTRELLRPLLKAWLDEHLPGIVQAKVEEEVERIARGRVR